MGTLSLQNKRNEAMYKFGMFALFGLMIAAILTFAPQLAFAAIEQDMFKAILSVVYTIVRIVGVIFVLLGIVKLVIAYANEQGPEQQNALMMSATGIVLVLLPSILAALHLENDIGKVNPNTVGG